MRWIIAAFLAVPTNLFAQSVDSTGYVFGGLVVPWEQGATTDEPRTYLAAPGGWSTGLFLGGGAKITGHLSVEAEFHRTGIMEQIEPSRYGITYSAQRRDTLAGFGARVHVPLSPRLVMEPVGLFGIVWEESWLAQQQENTGLPPTGDLTSHPPFVNSWGTALTGGVDIRAGGRRVALLPGFRVHRFRRDAEEGVSSTWPGGVSKWGWELTLGGRLDF